MKAIEVYGNTVVETDLLTEDQWLRKYQKEKRYSRDEVEKTVCRNICEMRERQAVLTNARRKKKIENNFWRFIGAVEFFGTVLYLAFARVQG